MREFAPFCYNQIERPEQQAEADSRLREYSLFMMFSFETCKVGVLALISILILRLSGNHFV